MHAAEESCVEDSSTAGKVIASYVSPHAYAPRTRAALVGLGYHVIAAATRGRFDDDWRPDLRVVDDRHYDKLPVEDYLPRTPVIVLGGSRPQQWRDSRVVGTVSRPAELADLYPLIQQALEDTPRRAARAPTQLPARCSRADQRCVGDIVWLSSAGCLFRTDTALTPESDFNLLFPLPRGRMVHTRARVKYCVGGQVGMAFHDPPEPSQRAISEFVTKRLATARF
jgi:hypothetical protein